MSILIKGMDMPESCDQCQFCDDGAMCHVLEVDLLGDGEELEGMWYLPDEYRCNRCPLVPISPHGRLIDADAAEMLLQKYYDQEDDNIKKHAIGECIMIVKDDAPTVIPAEEEQL